MKALAIEVAAAGAVINVGTFLNPTGFHVDEPRQESLLVFDAFGILPPIGGVFQPSPSCLPRSLGGGFPRRA